MPEIKGPKQDLLGFIGRPQDTFTSLFRRAFEKLVVQFLSVSLKDTLRLRDLFYWNFPGVHFERVVAQSLLALASRLPSAQPL